MSSAIADRIRAYAEEQGISPRALSLACGWDGSHLGTVLRRLDAGKDVRTATLDTIAATMGRPVTWLLTGETPEGSRLDAHPGWSDADTVAAERYRIDADTLRAIGGWRLPEPLPAVDAAFVVAVARAYLDAR